MKLSKLFIAFIFSGFAYAKILKPLIYSAQNLEFDDNDKAASKNAFEGLNTASNSWKAYGLVQGFERIQIEAAVQI